MSGLRNKIYLPFAEHRAALFAFAKPKFSLFQMKLTVLNFSLKKSLLSSVELLSATNISASIFCIAFSTEHRHCSKKNFTL